MGYRLHIVKTEAFSSSVVTNLIRGFVPNAEMESNAGAEAAYVLPSESSNKYDQNKTLTLRAAESEPESKFI